jgi:hypothetical protein
MKAVKNKVVFKGQKYISARRASEISGYNSDYLGQLCRGEKLHCRAVKGIWFIKENSLLEHIKTNSRKKTSPLLLKAQAREKERVSFDNEKYISAIRASDISGYNSDYIGQLCRGKKLHCRLISRTWFVKENSLLEHVKTSSRKKTSPLLLETPDQDKEKVFFAEDKKVAATLLKSNLVKEFSFFNKVLTRKFFAASFLTLIISLSISVTVVSLSSPLVRDSEVSVLKPVETITANLKDFLSTSSLAKRYEGSFLSRAYWKVVYFKDNLKRKMTTIFKKGPVVKKGPVARKGSVVVPTPKTDKEEDIDLLKKHIEESFSDEVEIVADPSNTSGVIKPVFREDMGEEYLYVMVPISED